MLKLNFHLISFALLAVISSISTSAVCQKNSNPKQEVNTIVLHLSETNLEEAELRFITYLSGNGYQLSSLSKQQFERKTKIETEQSKTVLPTLTKITSSTNPQLSIKEKEFYETKSRIFSDVMNGPFAGSLAFKFEKEENTVKIIIWGYVYRHNMLSDSKGLRMQNKGKDLNWAQKSMFRAVDKLLNDFPRLEKITFTNTEF